MARTIEAFVPEAIADAIPRAALSPKALDMLRAQALAPNRTMSRIELARSVGGSSVNTTNSVLGSALARLADVLDPALRGEWKPAAGASGAWVVFGNHGPQRWTPVPAGEPDAWVFVMREPLAQALLIAGVVSTVTPLDDEARAAVEAWENDDEDSPLWEPPDPLNDIAQAQDELDELPQTEYHALVLARLGQGVFRDRVIDAWDGQCAVTGSAFLPALTASHIKAWIDSTNSERLDPANGLLLVATLDRLFDAGFITFDDDGAIRISPIVPPEDYGALGLSPAMRLRNVPEAARPYLEIHRAEYFVAGVEAEVDAS
jgi:hypothetical protein